MAISLVQSCQNGSGSNVTNLTGTFTNSITKGNLVVIAATTSGINFQSFSDGPGDSIIIPYQNISWQAGGRSMSIGYVMNSLGGSNTVRVNLASATCAIVAMEFSGVATVNTLDQSAIATGNSASLNSGNIFTNNPTEVLVGALGTVASGPSAGSGYSNLITNTTVAGIGWCGLEEQTVSVQGGYAATASATSGQWIAAILAFQAPLPLTPSSPILPKQTRKPYSFRPISKWRGV